MRANKPVAFVTGVFVAGHYGAALYVEAKAGHRDTTVPQPPVVAMVTAASSTSTVTAMTYSNAITDVEYAAPAHEPRPFLIARST
jgi:hypothetical protein